MDYNFPQDILYIGYKEWFRVAKLPDEDTKMHLQNITLSIKTDIKEGYIQEGSFLHQALRAMYTNTVK